VSTAAPADRLLALLDRLRAEPGRAAVTMRTEVTLAGEELRCEAPLRSHVVTADEPRSVGGDDSAPNPVEIALAAVATCQAITYRVWATKLGVRLDRVRIEAEGDFDSRGFFGLDDSVTPGLAAVRLRVDLDGPEPAERYRDLADAVDRHCPVLDLLSRPVPVERVLGGAGAG
jgi:putative redox protein